MTITKINKNGFVAFGTLFGHAIFATGTTRAQAFMQFTKKAQPVFNQRQLRAVK